MNTGETCAQRLIRQFGLEPHPEGGHYRETYRSPMRVDVAAGRRAASTAIYYLLERGDHSAWHRIASDELWHFHAGSALHVHVLDGHGGLTTHRLGDPLREPGCDFQAVVPAGRWFAAELAVDAGLAPAFPHDGPGRTGTAADASDGGALDAFAFVGCTVAPGFEFSEFELADPEALVRQYPAHADLIRRLAPGRR